jgi:ATP-dependent Clp protease protease subunit
LLELFNTTLQNKAAVKDPIGQSLLSQKISQEYGGQKFNAGSQNTMPKLVNSLAQKNFLEKSLTSENLLKSSEKGLSQRILRKEYAQDKNTIGSSWSSSFNNANSGSLKSLNYLDFYSYKDSYNEFKGAQRSSGGRQADKTLQEEEAKKVFVIINSFGGSVGNGITVHDALQFIKAGSLTLGLGVAASAASLALAGGTIGERYVTEGCHVMIHQPEGGIQGQASDIWIDSQEIMKIRLDVAEIYSLATYRPRHKILRDLDRDFYLTATETIHYGLADEIATNEVMHEIIEMTSKVWDYHDSKQQRLLESRESSNSGLDTQAQN